MGSGCVTNSSNGYFQKLTPDFGVKYTGDPIPALGICTGDTLKEIEAIVLQKIIDYSTGTGITIPNIDLKACALFVDHVTCCEGCDDLPCLMEIIFESLCTLYTDITELQTAVNDLLIGPYNTGCLPIATNSTLKVIIQSLITEFCKLQTRVSTLETTVNTITSTLNTTIGNFLLNAITSCTGTQNVIKTGSGATASIAFKGFAPIGSIMPYGGSLSVFDPSGLGISGSGACGWALCNGNNGTVNMIGLVPLGTTDMVGTAPIPPPLTMPINSIGGEYFHTLLNSEIPTVPFSGTGNHSHRVRGVSVNTSTNGAGSNASFVLDVCTSVPGFPGVATNCAGTANNVEVWFDGRTSIESVAITGNIAGGGSKHENRMPYRALYYIQRIS